jgi:hypothetical protein
MDAKSRYDHLTSYRTNFLQTAVECSELTIPYLIQRDEFRVTHQSLKQPWQAVGAKGVVTLASKLMLALLPPQTTFFKLQLRDDKLGTELPAEMRSELDLNFAKIERMVMDSIAASSDRVVVHQALKHLVVGGNALIYMGKDGLKHYPLNRYVVERDGNGHVIEIVTKELINKKLLPKNLVDEKMTNGVVGSSLHGDDVEIYTHVKLDNNRWVWYQEAMDKQVPGSEGKAPKNATPWLVLRFNTVDGESYGRGRCEEFLGDLKSLNALSQSIVEGAAAAAKVVFVVSPSSTTKPSTIAQAGNGAIVQGRPEDIGVIQVGKTADFNTAMTMMQQLERRLAEAFLILNVRQSERTTAEEVRLTQLELEQQLGGLFSLLTNEFLLGRGQDRESLTAFVMTIAQTLGPEAMLQYINADEAIKRLAAAQGIDVLNLVKSMDQRQQEKQGALAQQQQMLQMQQMPDMLKTPIADPSKNPNAEDAIAQYLGGGQQSAPPMQ